MAKKKQEGFNEEAGFEPTDFAGEDVTVLNPEVEGTNDKRVFHDNEGNEISCSEFCRLKFMENMSKKEISDTYDINYRTVYGACQNLTNDAPAASRGRQATATITVASTGEVVSVVEGVNYINGVTEEEAGITVESLGELTNVDRKEWITGAFEKGMTRQEIAAILGVSHGVVYQATKELGEGRSSSTITLEDGTVVKRTEHIRALFAGGMSRKDIKDALGVEYNVVYQATKEEKSDLEKLNAAIDVVAKYADKVANKEDFLAAIELLRTADIAEVATEVEAAE